MSIRSRRRSSSKYRIIPIIISSLIIFVILCALVILIWSIIVFANKTEVSENSAIPAIVWIIALFISSGLMTFLTKGGTVIPALFLSGITVILSALLASDGAVSAGGFILKLLVSILAAGLGFTVVKLLLMFSGRLKRPPKKKQQQIAPQLFNDFNDEDDPGFIEYKG